MNVQFQSGAIIDANRVAKPGDELDLDLSLARAFIAAGIAVSLEPVPDPPSDTALAEAVDQDPTLAGNSDAMIPSQRAVKAYVDAHAGGGSSPIQTATVTLTAEQIRALPTVFPVIVAAPGAGKYLNVIQALISSGVISDFGNLAGDGSADIELAYGDNESNATPIQLISNVILTGQSGLLSYVGSNFTTASLAKSAFENKHVTVASDNSLGNFTGGDGTLTVTVYYTVVTLQ